MNQCVTPPTHSSDPGLDSNPPLAVPDDFLALLDKQLRRRNERLIERLLAWAELLDGVGWSVAIKQVGVDFWLSERAKRDLQRLSGVPETWTDLLALVDGISAESVHLKGEGVILWSGQGPTKNAPGPAADLTRREAEVMSWLREGKTGPEIAIILGCATRTVEKHLANLYRKLGIKNRAEAILKALNPID